MWSSTSARCRTLFQTIQDPNGPDPSIEEAPEPAAPDQGPEVPPNVQGGPLTTNPQATLEAIIARAIQQGLAQGLQQDFLQPVSQPVHTQPSHTQEGLSDDQQYSPEHSERDSLYDEEEESRELALSDDEGLAPDQPAFIGLFRPQLFWSLLYKALAVTRLESSPPPEAGPSDGQDPATSLFVEPTAQPELIPAPKLFTDVVQRQWSLPGTGPAPNGLDKHLYQTAPALSNILQVTLVDGPIAALTSSSRLTGAPEESLRPEDRRDEKTLIKAHQSTAWAVRTATLASFFNRASLLWLKQLQDRLLPSDTHTHQDLNKIVAALEYSADATLNSARFVAKTIRSTVTSRRLLWLRHWQADVCSKWQLASSPYSSDALFGPPLEPLLVETRDRCKILLASRRSGS